MSSAEGKTPRQRADKARNRIHILEVAEDFFGHRGVSASLETIARRAGVGPGTIYRHFPSRETLIAALLQARYERLFDRFEVIKAESSGSDDALEHWLDALFDYVTAFEGLPEPLRIAVSEESSPLAITCQAFITATDELLTAAQRDGHARPWIRARDLFLSVLATGWLSGAALADESSSQAVRAILRSGWSESTSRDE